MKAVLLSLIFTSVTTITYAQTMDVKVKDVEASEPTTISIQKGSTTTNKKKYEVTEGSEDITGDKDVLKKNAEKNWKKACDEFKKEVKEMNKENKIVSLSCGTMVCSKEGVESTCQSKGTHKIRILVEE